MATSGTATFNLDLNQLVEEAFERCGAELRTGYDLRTARRSLNLLTIEWANRGINLWTVEESSFPMVQGTGTYDLPTDTIDILDFVIRTNGGSSNQQDISMSRIAEPTYANIPNKNTQGRPLQVYVNRQAEVPNITVWPLPNSASYTFVYWYLRRIQDAGNGVNTQDIPFRFLPCMVAGLAFYLSQKLPNALDRMQMLKMEYEEQWTLSFNRRQRKSNLEVNT
jgi:hypothetical protein